MSDMTNGIYNRFVLANIDIILVIKIVKYPSKKIYHSFHECLHVYDGNVYRLFHEV
jgi:hypothetical protein